MANTPAKSGNVARVAMDGSSAFDLADYLGVPHVRLRKVCLYPAATNDVFTVREGSATGPELFKYKDVTATGKDFDFPGLPMRPYIKGDEAPNGGIISFLFE